MTEPTREQLEEIAEDARLFLDAADTLDEHGPGAVTTMIAQRGDFTTDPDDAMYRLARTGVAITAATLNHVAACECGDDDGTWVLASTLDDADADPVGVAVGNAVAAAANRDTDQTAAVLGSFYLIHGLDGLTEFAANVLGMFSRLRRETVR